MAPQRLQIRPGDVIWIDNVLLGELKSRIPNGTLIPSSEFDATETVPTTEPEDSRGDDHDALERELEEIADLFNTEAKAAR